MMNTDISDAQVSRPDRMISASCAACSTVHSVNTRPTANRLHTTKHVRTLMQQCCAIVGTTAGRAVVAFLALLACL